MGRTVQEIFQESAGLPDRERAELAGMLIESLDGESDPDVEAAWAEEIKERVRQARAGELESRPWREVLADLAPGRREKA
jgi:Putative addiction module component